MENSWNFKEELEKRKQEAEAVIAGYLPMEDGFAGRLAEAMNYSMNAPGKRLRPIIMRETYKLFGGDGEEIYPFMAALEMIHTHSLIHDDLPALDNDEYRRGKKTTHTVYGEALGILSGDALLNYAYETAFSAFSCAGDIAKVGTALRILAGKTGICGMLGGQSVDVMNDGAPLTEEMLNYIYENKTSALIQAAMMIGAALAGAAKEELDVVSQAALKIGLAFQIRDDILDVTSTTEELGKAVFSDEKNGKTTYVTLKGIDCAREMVRELTDEALRLLAALGRENKFLNTLFLEMVSRKK